jgi:twinkle protein
MLGLTEDNKIAIPIVKDGKLVNIKYRTIPPADKFYMREKGCPSYLFNGDKINPNKSVILTEGEFDAMMATQLGFLAVSGITGAASGLTPGEMKQLDLAEKVFVLYDSDEAGQSGARKIIDRIGHERCVNIVLPAKDLNDFILQGGSREELVELMRAAEKVKPENVVSFKDLLQEVEQFQQDKGIKLGYDALDAVFSGLGPGKLTIVSADTRVGKSTFGLNICKNLALDNIPVLVFSLENQPVETVKRVSSMLTGKEFPEINKTEMEELKELYSEWPMYFFFSGDKEVDMSLVRETSIAAKKYYGIQAILVDHVQFFSRSVSNQANELSIRILNLKRLAVGLGVPIIAISHISRKEHENRIPNIHDLKGSSSIEQDADQVLVLWRNLSPIDNPDQITEEEKRKYEEDQSKMLVRIHKDRNGQGFGDFWFHYDMKTGLIEETNQ